MKNRIRLTESQLHAIIRQAVNEAIDMENNDDWYNEEDSYGKIGKPGYVRSYDLGNYPYVSNLEEEAEYNNMSLKEYLKYWFEETYDGNFEWVKSGSGYGYNGDEICSFVNPSTGGIVIFKNIYDQVMCDEHEPNV